jgi:hypothetical protein
MSARASIEPSRRTAVVVMSIAIALGVASCGEDGNGRASGGDGPSKAAGMLPDPDRQLRDRVVQGSGPEAAVQEVIDDMQDGLLTLSGWGVCNELSEPAQLRVAKRGRCVKAYDRILRSGDNPTTRRVRSRVLSVTPRRNGAMALVASPGRKPFRLRLVDSLGQLKLPRLDLDDPTGLVAE